MSYFPFGNGPRNCIGSRIGLLQAKVGLVHILKNHYATTCEKTPAEIIFDPLSLLLSYKGGVYLKLVNDKRYERNARQWIFEIEIISQDTGTTKNSIKYFL